MKYFQGLLKKVLKIIPIIFKNLLVFKFISHYYKLILNFTRKRISILGILFLYLKFLPFALKINFIIVFDVILMLNFKEA